MRLPTLFDTPIVLVAGVALLMACNPSKTLPSTMAGSYVRSEPAMMGLLSQTAQMEITTTGLASRAGGMGVEMGITANGPQGRITESTATSVLFKSVSCSGAVCSFTGSEGHCEGTITKDDAGDVTIVASGLCASSLAGKWLGPKSAASLAPATRSFH